MGNIRIIDCHCDTLSNILEKKSNIEDDTNHICLKKLIDSNVGVQVFAAWVGPKRIHGPALQRGLNIIDLYYNILNSNKDILYPILTFDDITYAWKDKKIGTFLAVEGGDILEGQISNIRILYRLGVRMLTLTWNDRNEIADGVMERYSKSGFSQFGREVIYQMNLLGMIIDVSHISETGFWDVIELSNHPIVASHSNAKHICNNIRNLDDKQIKAIAQKSGMIGINFYPRFLSNDNHTTIDDIIRHIEYIAQLVGVDYVGFGSDFDGIEMLPDGINGPENFYNVINMLLRLNYKEEDVNKIANGNFLRVFKQVTENKGAKK